MVDESFSTGRDSLAGMAEFADEVGERKISLTGPRKSIAYHSLNFGKEQWITDASTGRIRRIANRQWKKNMIGSLLTYEDMLKFPTDFFLEYSSCKGVKTTDSTFEIAMMLRPVFQSFYTKLEVTLSRNPVLLRKIAFYGPQDKKLKTMELRGYKETEGKWLATDMAMFDCDTLSSVKMCMRNFSFQVGSVAQKDKTKATGISLLSKLMGLKSEASETAGMEASGETSGEVNN
jgi:hypothetical protein